MAEKRKMNYFSRRKAKNLLNYVHNEEQNSFLHWMIVWWSVIRSRRQESRSILTRWIIKRPDIFFLLNNSIFDVNEFFHYSDRQCSRWIKLKFNWSTDFLPQYSSNFLFFTEKKNGNNKTIRLWRFKSFFEIFGNIWKLVFMTCWIDIESNSIQRHIDSFQQSISTFSTRFYLNRTSVGFFVVWFPLEIG